MDAWFIGFFYVAVIGYIYELIQHRREVRRWRKELAAFGQSNANLLKLLERQAAILSEYKL